MTASAGEVSDTRPIRPRRRWLTAGLVLVLCTVLFGPPLVRLGQVAVTAPSRLLGVFVQVVTAGAQQVALGVQESFAVAEASDALKARLGEPLTFPALDQIEWVERTADTPSDEIQFRYPLTGPHGAATATGTLHAAGTKIEIVRFSVEPDDGGGAIDLR